jgi:hypothetical protein
MTELTSPDLTRCQAEIPNGQGPFTFGGGHKMIRCNLSPKVIITERAPGADGQVGSMSLCEHCFEVFQNQPGTPDVFIKVMDEETDLEYAIDVVFRSAHGLERAKSIGGSINPETMCCVAAAITLAKEELERRGWKWQPDTAPSVIKSQGD